MNAPPPEPLSPTSELLQETYLEQEFKNTHERVLNRLWDRQFRKRPLDFSILGGRRIPTSRETTVVIPSTQEGKSNVESPNYCLSHVLQGVTETSDFDFKNIC
jgi:hypothetical protein